MQHSLDWYKVLNFWSSGAFARWLGEAGGAKWESLLCQSQEPHHSVGRPQDPGTLDSDHKTARLLWYLKLLPLTGALYVSMCYHTSRGATFWILTQMATANATVSQKSLQIIISWSMQLRVTQSKSRNKQTNNEVEVPSSMFANIWWLKWCNKLT